MNRNWLTSTVSYLFNELPSCFGNNCKKLYEHSEKLQEDFVGYGHWYMPSLISSLLPQFSGIKSYHKLEEIVSIYI